MPSRTEWYDYDLPPDRIAQRPLERRDASRLLVLDRKTGAVQHRHFHDLPDYLRPGDVLVWNDTRVFKARLFVRKDTGAKIELFFLSPGADPGTWQALARPARRLRPGAPLTHEETGTRFLPLRRTPDGEWIVATPEGFDLYAFLEAHGVVPLPPYIKEELKEADRYQTIYAHETGSTAAPTAGLHFTEELLARVRALPCEIHSVTLHIGLDTFRPIQTETVEDHRMHSEWCVVPDETAEAVVRARREGRRVVVVGTTAVRALESWARAVKTERWSEWLAGEGTPSGAQSLTDLFITEGYEFCVVDALVTNFHLPRSTLLVLVSAFAGRENVLAAYAEAMREGYRFFSFGDAMFIA